MKLLYKLKPYLLIVITFATVYLISNRFSEIITRFVKDSGDEGEKLLFFVTVIMVFSIGFFVYYLAKSTPIPSFVLVIFFGFAAKDLLNPLLTQQLMVSILVTLGAIFILFGGGLETPFKNFKKLFGYIFSLAFIGTILTSMLLSFVIYYVAQLVGFELTLPAIIVLSAALASTDPAAIIPCFDKLVFRKNRVKYIAISESALNDVVGAILTIVFLDVFQHSAHISSLLEGYQLLLNWETIWLFAKEVVIGLVIGVAGYYILELWNRFKQRIKAEEETDAAFFIVIPFLVYTISQLFGGSGFMAAFLCALLFNLSEHIKHVEHYFNHTVKAFMKPMIFIILGAMIDLDSLIQYAPVGILVAILFMFVVRPIVVFVTLGPFRFSKKKRLGWNELFFLSFVRETGVIPAVLLVTIAGSGIPGAESILPIGMWVILFTLLIEPPLTPFIAKRLMVADAIATDVKVQLGGGTEPTAVLVTRGNSFGRRLPQVVDWATQHNIFNIAILNSPEDDCSDAVIAEKKQQADTLFNEINDDRKSANEPKIDFEFITEPGYLQDNINRYIATHTNISIIFAGKRMLDFRSNDIKNLSVPFLFID